MRTVVPVGLALASILSTSDAAFAQARSTDDIAKEIQSLRSRLDALETELKGINSSNGAARANARASSPGLPASIPTEFAAAALGEIKAIPTNVIGGAPDQPLQNPMKASAFQLTAGTGATKAEVLLTARLGNAKPKIGSDGHAKAGFDSLSLSASSTLAKSGPTNIGTLSGFDDGFVFKLRWSHYSVTLRHLQTNAQAADAALQRAKELCSIAIGTNGNADTCAAKDDHNLFIANWLPRDEYRSFQANFFPAKAAFAWGLEGSVGFRSFDYRDAVTANKLKAEKAPWGAKVFGGIFPSNGSSALLGSFGYERTFKAADALAICTGTTPTQSCPVDPAGPPKLTENYILSAGGRFKIRTGFDFLPEIAVSPTANYEFKADEFGLDVPLYLIPSDAGKLSGGLRFGYKTGDTGFTAGVFVGSVFSLFQ